jgi:hypothetical protein
VVLEEAGNHLLSQSVTYSRRRPARSTHSSASGAAGLLIIVLTLGRFGHDRHIAEA